MAEGVTEIKDITISYLATGSAGNFYMDTDMPGGTLTTRRQQTLAVVTTRTEITIPCDTNLTTINGKLVQFRAAPGVSGVLQLFWGKVRFRVIGVYLDGTAGDTWSTQPITLGS